jgi:hypothetical protein
MRGNCLLVRRVYGTVIGSGLYSGWFLGLRLSAALDATLLLFVRFRGYNAPGGVVSIVLLFDFAFHFIMLWDGERKKKVYQ